METKIGEFFGADVVVSVYVPHDKIMISPKEERLFTLLLELEERVRKMKETQKEMSKAMLPLVDKTLQDILLETEDKDSND